MAPAKINLSLRVLRKREDGFHEIETVMAPISLYDELEFTFEGSGITFSCSDPSLPRDDSNLVLRAARRFYETASCRPEGLSIRLTKAIPHGAGLGGGSSDAAKTLEALNNLHGHPLSRETLLELAAELGSDVPFFLAGGGALCRGRGEQVAPHPTPSGLPLLLLKPEFGVPTPWAYRQWSQSKELPGISYTPQPFEWGELVNDLERSVFEKYLFLATLKQWLLEQPESRGALMSGSGATCFALLRSKAEGATLEARARQEFGPLWTALCHTL